MSRQPTRKSGNDQTGDIGQKAEKLKDDIAETATVASDVAELAYEELAEQLQKLKRDVADLSEALVRAGRDTADEAGARAKERVTQAGDGVAQAADHVEDLLRDAEQFARKRPGVAMGIAAAMGFLLARTMSRR